MTLPLSFQRYGATVFGENSEVAHEWSVRAAGCDLSIYAADPNGFDVRFEIEPDVAIVHWGIWHSHFEPAAGIDTLVEDLFGLLRDMLSSDVRVRERYAGPQPYRGFLESFDGSHWLIEQQMGSIFWNYLPIDRSEHTPTRYCLVDCESRPSGGSVP